MLRVPGQRIFQYIKMWPDQENFIRSHLRLGDEIHLAAAELSLAEKINVRQEETQAYAFTAFLADAGGAPGLFLGLSVLQILHWLCSLYYYLLKTFNCFNHSVRQVSFASQSRDHPGADRSVLVRSGPRISKLF